MGALVGHGSPRQGKKKARILVGSRPFINSLRGQFSVDEVVGVPHHVLGKEENAVGDRHEILVAGAQPQQAADALVAEAVALGAKYFGRNDASALVVVPA
jgi:hypothetical protein